MSTHNELQEVLLQLETEGWEAQHQGRGRAYYSSLLTDDALMVLPGAGLLQHEAALDAMDMPPWSWFKLRNPVVMTLGAEAAVLTYRVQARRDFASEYQAIVASTYVFNDEQWRLAMHQETVV